MPRRKGPSLDKGQVVSAAIACIEAEGPAGIGISRVARRLGIKPPSLYNHVANGDDLAFEVCLEGNRQMLEAARSAVRSVYEPREVLLALALELRAWALENPALYAVMSQVPPQNQHPELAPVMRDLLELFERPLAQLGVRGDDAIHAIRGLRAAMHGFVLLESSGQYQLEQGTDRSYRWMVDVTLRGLSAR